MLFVASLLVLNLAVVAQDRTTQKPRPTTIEIFDELNNAKGWHYDESTDQWIDGQNAIYASRILAERGLYRAAFESFYIMQEKYIEKEYIVLVMNFYNSTYDCQSAMLAATSIEEWQKIYNLGSEPVFINFYGKITFHDNGLSWDYNTCEMKLFQENYKPNEVPAIVFAIKKENSNTYRFRWLQKNDYNRWDYIWENNDYFETDKNQFMNLTPAKLKR